MRQYTIRNIPDSLDEEFDRAIADQDTVDADAWR